MRHVYVVLGSTGEYSDHREWMVAAYLSEASAANRVRECQGFANGLQKRQGERYQNRAKWDDMMKNGPDPSMQFDYTGTKYNFYQVALVDG